jgi:hypothetical protein
MKTPYAFAVGNYSIFAYVAKALKIRAWIITLNSSRLHLRFNVMTPALCLL